MRPSGGDLNVQGVKERFFVLTRTCMDLLRHLKHRMIIYFRFWPG